MRSLSLRTWIEIDSDAFRHNTEQFLKLIPRKKRFMAVIKSNAYGHGLSLMGRMLARYPRAWIGVDSITEALRIRHDGLTNSMLVLGHTLPARIEDARRGGITITVSQFETLADLARMRVRPAFHLKIDTGMHRQGFLPEDLPRVIGMLKRAHLIPEGMYTHFAAAKDKKDPLYTRMQTRAFADAVAMMRTAGFSRMILHAAASGATLLFPETHFDMVRIGMGLYGYWPSAEAAVTYRRSHTKLKPVLTWKTVVGEVKEIPKESCIGYDSTECVRMRTRIAVLPIGYWHGFDRGLSSAGEVLIRGKRARVLGRVSMDMIAVDVTKILGVHVGDEVVIIGRQGKDAVWADEIAKKIDTTAYEVIARLNPLIRRVEV